MPELLLPAEGTDAPPPTWPLPGRRPPGAVLIVWAELWTTPQSVAWRELGAGVAAVVARYARARHRADGPDPSAALLAEVRHLEEALGLSPMALLRLRWRIEPTRPLAEVLPMDVSDAERRRRVLGTSTPARRRRVPPDQDEA